MKSILKLLFIGASLAASGAYAGCVNDGTYPEECDWTVNLGAVTAGVVQGCLPAEVASGLQYPSCYTFTPTGSPFTQTYFQVSNNGKHSFNNFITFVGTVNTPVPMPPIGDTEADINANYPGIIVQAFQTFGPAMDARINNMEDTELVLLAQAFIATNGNQALLHQLAAQNLSAKELVRWQAAFGQAMVSPYVSAYARPIVAQAYFSDRNVGGTVNGLPNPLPTDFTIGEMWTEFRVWQGQSVAGTIVSVLATVATKTGAGKAFRTGYIAGSGIYLLLVKLDPDFGYHLITAFGGTYTDGTTIYFFPQGTTTGGGQGYFENADGTICDGYGNCMPPPTKNVDDPNPHYGDDNSPPLVPDPYYFYPPEDPICNLFLDDDFLGCTY